MTVEEIRALITTICAPRSIEVSMPHRVWGSKDMGIILKNPSSVKQTQEGPLVPKASFAVSANASASVIEEKTLCACDALKFGIQTGWQRPKEEGEPSGA